MYGETDGVLYIFLPCANISILTVTKFTEMNRVVGRSVCTLLRDAALGRNLPDNLKSWPLSPEKCWKYINWIHQPDFAILIFRTSADHSCVLPQLFSCHLSQKWSNAPPQQREGRNSQCRGRVILLISLEHVQHLYLQAGVLREDHTDSGRHLWLKFVGGEHLFF